MKNNACQALIFFAHTSFSFIFRSLQSFGYALGSPHRVGFLDFPAIANLSDRFFGCFPGRQSSLTLFLIRLSKKIGLGCGLRSPGRF
jgi:hypothetical protein